MAHVILSAAGEAIGGPVGRTIGGRIGRAIDHAALNALKPDREVGRRLQGLQLTAVAEGEPIAAAFGRARVGGQVIWAARFKERRVARQTSGSKGGPTTYAYSYSLSFAIGLCEGPIDGVGRIWANGKAMDLSGVTWRVHLGTEDQAPDPLIEAVEGTSPAYRGLAYLVFEDLALDAYGDRPPDINVEILRRPRWDGAPAALEDRLTGVCLIPGAGEFVYATGPVLRRDGLTRSTAENVHSGQGRADLEVSLDQLAAALPNLTEVSLVVAWFGTDLRAGRCQVRPGVEEAEKATAPVTWRAGGVGREDAHLVSRTAAGGPAYGGTPADEAVLQAIAALKARGWRVTLYPFLMMDIAPGNGLPDPYGGAEQAAYPWRGRITGSDRTAGARAEVAAFFGSAAPGDFTVRAGEVAYAGPPEWSWRRCVLHLSALAQAAGGADAVLIGSEFRGLTTLRDAADGYPAVDELVRLARDVKAMLGPATAVAYAADWSEYFGHQPPDGSGDVRYHLDPLWADPAVDFVGVDWYPPITDWRDAPGERDAVAGFRGPRDRAYLAAGIAGGEAFDWYYANEADRAAQRRTPIADGAYGEPWVFRPKDLAAWWSNPHHERRAGVRQSAPTAWVPGSKPIRLVEFGCAAIDKGANAPNLFLDPKSAESRLPPFSTGVRDDAGQRAALEAILAHFAPGAPGNPTSSVYGGPMVQGLSAWCWDARPYPDFPARADVWADAGAWARGHWLNGRLGAAPVASLVGAMLARGGVDPGACDLAGADGVVEGAVLERPLSLAQQIAPLAFAFAFDMAERGGRITALGRSRPADLRLTAADLAGLDPGAPPVRYDHAAALTPDAVRVRAVDPGADYQTLKAEARAEAGAGGGGVHDLDLPLALDRPGAQAAAARALARALAEDEAAEVALGPAAALALEVGDLVTLPGEAGALGGALGGALWDVLWRVTRLDLGPRPAARLTRAEPPVAADGDPGFQSGPRPRPSGPPAFALLDLPLLPGAEDDARPLIAVAAEPWRAMSVQTGPGGPERARIAEPAWMGASVSDLPSAPPWRWDAATRLTVRVEGGASLQSRADAEVLAGANALAIQTPAGAWEVLQFAAAALVAPETWTLSRLLRGQLGTEADMAARVPAGAAVVVLDGPLARAELAQSERGLPLNWRAAPAGLQPTALNSAQAAFAWQGIAWRPLAPAHLTAARAPDGRLALSWIRRTRLHGDAWDGGDAPLSEEVERYRVRLFDGATPLNEVQTDAPSLILSAVDAARLPAVVTLEVAQLSAIVGWGAAARRTVRTDAPP